tara:strand:+ start:291 stop:1073 length:783 start_codon:yes stop_codon:yes gene_type:complete
MELVDTHSHLYSSQFDKDRTAVIKNAINSGVKKILLPNISSSYTQKMLKLCEEFPKTCFPMMGLHPCDVKKESMEKELQHVKKELEKGIYIGVGEIGIDLHWDKSTLEIQKEAFIYQIKLAKKYKLPIVIHVRNSFNETIKIIEDMNDSSLKGVFHCFTGSEKDAQRIISLKDFYLGIGGVLTFKNSNLKDVIKSIDTQHILLETDAPYLTPAPNRGKRNESKYIVDIAKELAQVYNLDVDEIAQITTYNANSLFNLKIW